MSYWDILGIAATDDGVAIKRAYARALKHNRPDDDAAAYQQLREAYDWAQQYARWAKANPDALDDDADEDADDDAATGEAAGIGLETSVSTPVHSAQLAPLAPEPPAAHRLIAADPAAALMPADGVCIMGEGAASPLIHISVPAADAPDLAPRWHRHRLPEHEAVWADPMLGVDALEVADVDDVLAHLDDWCASDDDDAARARALVHLMHELPFGLQDETEARCAGFVLEHEAPPRLVLTLAGHFAWGQDFRLEQLIGEAAALHLYERVARAREDMAEHGPRGLKAVQQRLARFLTSARMHANRRPLRFWTRLWLSPLAHFGDAHQPEARIALSVEAIPWRPVSAAIRVVFFLSLLAIAAGLGWVHGPHGVFVDTPPWARAAGLLLAGGLGYAAVGEWPLPGLMALFAPLGRSRFGHWLAHIRTRPAAYWIALLCLAAVALGIDAAPGVLGAAGLADWQVFAAALLACGAALAALWPRGEAWAPLMLPLWGALTAVFGVSADLGWAMALAIATAWIVLALLVAVCYPLLAERVFNAPFSLIRPHGVRWIFFFLFIKGVLAFYGLVLALSPPLWLFMYARSDGWPKAWLALVIAAGLCLAGVLPVGGLSFVVWLMATLFVMSRLGRLSGWLLNRPALRAA